MPSRKNSIDGVTLKPSARPTSDRSIPFALLNAAALDS